MLATFAIFLKKIKVQISLWLQKTTLRKRFRVELTV